MTRLPLAMLILAGAAIAQPAAAQDTGPVGPANEKINQVIVYGNDKCPEANGDEILVCAVLPEGDKSAKFFSETAYRFTRLSAFPNYCLSVCSLEDEVSPVVVIKQF